jgi:hypothetical protein
MMAGAFSCSSKPLSQLRGKGKGLSPPIRVEGKWRKSNEE